ncbi:MAG TPA: nitroreductase family protein [Ktedonobacterales bacterium]|nr:nitroreductase family protein [Ktedonobacterales bacterium]
MLVALLELTPDEVLKTTRSVRKRLDFSRPVESEVLQECLEIAQQAPTGGNSQGWHFVVVTDAEKRQALGDIYRRGWAVYRGSRVGTPRFDDSPRGRTLRRVVDSSEYLAEHIHEAPALVIPCVRGRLEGKTSVEQAGTWGSIIPAAWSFMLAARARGLGTTWTTVHLFFEQDAAEALGIPYAKFTQAALIPVAYTKGTDFSPASREALDTVVHWNQW